MVRLINLDKIILPAGGDSFSRFASVQIKGSSYVRDYCPEHKRDELIPQKRYHTDLGYWYFNGLHPKFSIVNAFLKAGQTDREIFNHFGPFWQSRDANQEHEHHDAREALTDALKISRTEDEFLKILHPRLFVDLNPGDRMYRVTNAFKEKYEKKLFTTEDFFTERNQDIRRLILRSGASLKEVLSRLTLVAEDGDGKLYEMKDEAERDAHTFFPSADRMRHLYVVCPSTGQEYLLQVPAMFQKPKDARRWTFDLPEDAEFAKEA
jgi:hypothetical protein